jgi:hypothetical protein
VRAHHAACKGRDLIKLAMTLPGARLLVVKPNSEFERDFDQKFAALKTRRRSRGQDSFSGRRE